MIALVLAFKYACHTDIQEWKLLEPLDLGGLECLWRHFHLNKRAFMWGLLRVYKQVWDSISFYEIKWIGITYR
ncbi:hypothetical protein C2R22_04970 [Salinigranum rubrum]|uniref:Uncharacterized protein n=1 Tax=Salinigranum rubrum TaxID=755307 RepID=A0A2I8VGQ0_9EURY|nr:hypothetical protein C2R22_04970 [Salinigranum rubrum]